MFADDELNQIKQIQDGVLTFDDLDGDLQSKLMDYFINKMPYGTAKARTGDPVEYIVAHLGEIK